jgi:RND superfamily putative drug exporter
MDTFLVRTLLVPATVILLGRRNWWPSAMGRSGAPRRQVEAHQQRTADPSEATP